MSHHRVSEDRFVLVNAVRLLVSSAIRETRTTTMSLVTRHGQLLLTLELFSHKPTSLSPLRIWPWHGGAYIKRECLHPRVHVEAKGWERREQMPWGVLLVPPPPPGHKNISEENHWRPRKAKNDRNMLLATFLSVGGGGGVKTLLASRDRLKPDAYVSLSAAGDTTKFTRKVRLYRCFVMRYGWKILYIKTTHLPRALGKNKSLSGFCDSLQNSYYFSCPVRERGRGEGRERDRMIIYLCGCSENEG